jgi:hypothetical protein
MFYKFAIIIRNKRIFEIYQGGWGKGEDLISVFSYEFDGNEFHVVFSISEYADGECPANARVYGLSAYEYEHGHAFCSLLLRHAHEDGARHVHGDENGRAVHVGGSVDALPSRGGTSPKT